MSAGFVGSDCHKCLLSLLLWILSLFLVQRMILLGPAAYPESLLSGSSWAF